jgi:hypothetical protein
MTRRKVLFVTYYWPPAGGIGVLRCLKIVKYLRQFGWEPVVFTSTASEYEFTDNKNNLDIPEGLEVHRIQGFNPTAIFKKISGRKADAPLIDIISDSPRDPSKVDSLGIWIRGNFFIPDARSFWIRPAVRAMSAWMTENKCDAIFSDGPPHTNTIAALKIAEKFNLPWLADFQDPWTQADYYAHMKIGIIADKIHRKWESRSLMRANMVSIASPSWAEDLQTLGRNDARVLYYGYDEADFKDYRPQHPSELIIFHGGLLGLDRNPKPVIQALSKLKNQLLQQFGKLEIRLAGSVNSSVVNDFHAAGLGDSLTLLGLIPRSEVFNEMAAARMLLLPINDAPNAKGRIPGKLFEMIRSGKEILALGPVQGDVAKLLAATQTGQTFEYADFVGVESYFKGLARHDDPNEQTPGERSEVFSNERLAEKVANWLDEISSHEC